jgi:GT2 family glycosyltransferase
MSGMIGHGTQPCGRLSYFGPWRQKCELLDGVLLATGASTLRRSGVRFDPLFEFHFYDLDFCRTARCGGLTLGTWPIAITQQGAGNYNDDNWLPSYAKYVNKWGS